MDEGYCRKSPSYRNMQMRINKVNNKKSDLEEISQDDFMEEEEEVVFPLED